MEQDPSDPRQDRGQDQTHQTENPTEDQAEDGYVSALKPFHIKPYISIGSYKDSGRAAGRRS